MRKSFSKSRLTRLSSRRFLLVFQATTSTDGDWEIWLGMSEIRRCTRVQSLVTLPGMQLSFRCLSNTHLTKEMTKASELMVRGVVCADPQHPISFIRQQMLQNSFSCLPIQRGDGRWEAISDVKLATWLRSKSWNDRKVALAMPLLDALESGLIADSTHVCSLSSDSHLDALIKKFNQVRGIS